MWENIKVKKLAILLTALLLTNPISKAFALTQDQVNYLNDVAQRQTQIELINQGVSPVTAYWGAWAMVHNPTSDCAANIAQIHMGNTFFGHDVGDLEVSGFCTPEYMKRETQIRREMAERARRNTK